MGELDTFSPLPDERAFREKHTGRHSSFDRTMLCPLCCVPGHSGLCSCALSQRTLGASVPYFYSDLLKSQDSFCPLQTVRWDGQWAGPSLVPLSRRCLFQILWSPLSTTHAISPNARGQPPAPHRGGRAHHFLPIHLSSRPAAGGPWPEASCTFLGQSWLFRPMRLLLHRETCPFQLHAAVPWNAGGKHEARGPNPARHLVSTRRRRRALT